MQGKEKMGKLKTIIIRKITIMRMMMLIKRLRRSKMVSSFSDSRETE
jgi:hypothetical protein